MKYSLELTVRSGKVTGFNDKGRLEDEKKSSHVQIKKENFSHATYHKKTKEVTGEEHKVRTIVNLVSKTSIEGMLYRLTGHLDKIDVCRTNSKYAEFISNTPYNIVPHFQPALMVMTNTTGAGVKSNPKTLDGISIEELKGIHFKEDIREFFKTNCLELVYKRLSEDTAEASVELAHLVRNEMEQYPDVPLFERIKTQYLDNKIAGLTPYNLGTEKKPVPGCKPKEWHSDNETWLLFLLHVVKGCKNNPTKLEAIKKGSTTFFGKTRHMWINESVRGQSFQAPSYAYKTDFTVQINNVPEEIILAIEEGSGAATWARGGAVDYKVSWVPNIYEGGKENTEINISYNSKIEGGK